MEGDVTKFRRKIGICRFFLILLCITVVALVIALIVVASKSKAETSESEAQAGFCKSGAHNINLEPPNPLPPFHDLTTEEVKSIKDYLYGREELNLVNSSDIRCNASYIFTMELKIPNKEATLNFLDNQQDQPDREAKVVIFRGDNQPQPDVKEYIVGPLPSPTYMKDYRTAPFHFRPFTLPELLDAGNMVHHEVQTVAGQLLQESYGGQIENCGDKCLSFFQLQNSESSSTSGHMDKRRTWFWLYQIVEFFSLHPVGFHVLVDLTGTTKAGYKIVKVSYGEASFDTLQDLMAAYESNAITKIRIPFPVNDEKLFSSLHMRGDPFPAEPASKPIQFEPHGKRYSISGRHIEYLGWEMDVRLSIVSGPQLFDIRYEGERIVYELSLQEAAAYYSAHNPAHRSSDFADSFFLIGNRVRTLIAGVDCPRHATFLSSHVVTEDREAPFKIDRAFCVFEHNTGIPLRRHLSRNNDEGKFFEGMEDVVLTVRTIATVLNYDYIFDFIFHQNGAIEVKAISNGYILTSFRTPAEDDYGFRLGEYITGNIHHHMFHFKVDMDVKGTSNTFEILNIEPVQVDNSKWAKTPGSKYAQTKLVRETVQTERDAALKFNFDKPKYLTFHNNNSKTKYGLSRAYRLYMKGMSKQVSSQQAFYLNLYRTVIGPTGFLLGR